MNKKITLFAILAILSMMFASFVFAATPSTDAIKLSLINQDPNPVSPGDYVTVKIRVENLGQDSVTGVKVTLVQQYPFSLDPGVSNVKSVGTMGAFQKMTDSNDLSAVVEYKLRVAKDAVEGTNKIKVQYESDASSMQTYEFDIQVKTQDYGLVISSVKSDKFEPGKSGNVEIMLSNPSDSTLRDVTVSLDLSSATLPFAPVDSATSKKVKFLLSNQESIFRFGLMPYATADSMVYKIPVTISYYDSANTLVEKNEIVGIVVGANADLSIYSDTKDFFAGVDRGTVTVKFVNKGLINVKLLSANLKDGVDYEVISSNENYIGSVDSNDFETADFTIIKKTSSDNFNLNLVATYMDANNNAYTKEVSIPVKLYPAATTSSNSSWIFIVIIVVVVAFIGFRVWKKKRKD
jgi:hypothetical protein